MTLCFCAAILLAGCTKYGTAVSTITDYSYANKQLTVNALVTDDGGCDYYMEQGFCYSLFCPPNLTDITFTLPLADTAYYVCAYVKNSAGLSYSDAVKVSTNPADYPAPQE